GCPRAAAARTRGRLRTGCRRRRGRGGRRGRRRGRGAWEERRDAPSLRPRRRPDEPQGGGRVEPPHVSRRPMSKLPLSGHALALLLGLTLVACASEPEVEPPTAPPSPAPADTTRAEAPAEDSTLAGDSILVGDPPTWVPGPLHAPPADWTAGVVDVARDDTPAAVLRDVRAGTHDDFVRVVFAFDGRVPGYHVEYVDRPVYHCASGEPMAIAGDAWLAVRFRIAAAHTEAGEATVAERDRRLGGPLLRQLTL